jgi:hypothetical protein
LARPQLRPQTINNGGDVPARRQHRYDDVSLPGFVCGIQNEVAADLICESPGSVLCDIID